jgi:hypothetical protein
VIDTGASEAEVTLDRLDLEGTKQIRPNAARPCRPAAAHFGVCEHGCRRNHLQRDKSVGGNHPTNVRSDVQGRTIFVRLYQTR